MLIVSNFLGIPSAVIVIVCFVLISVEGAKVAGCKVGQGRLISRARARE